MEKSTDASVKKRRRAFLTICACAAMGALLLSAGGSPEALAQKMPRSPALAVCAILGLYALKSATIVFPLNAIQMTAGFVFPTEQAIAVNLAGLVLCMSVPYFTGKRIGTDEVAKLTRKYPKLEALVDYQQDNSLFFCFFLRLLAGFPGDIVSMYFGATATPYWKNLLGGVLGALPHMLVATVFGSAILTPGSPEFWLSAGLAALIMALALVLYYFYSKLRQKRRRTK